MKALIVGGGIGGLTCAIALTKANIDPVVFEQAPALREAGAGLTLGSNALRVLDLLGLTRDILAAGAPLERGQICNASGRVGSPSEQGASMNTRPLSPFGVEVTADTPTRLDQLNIPELKRWIAEFRLAVLRNFLVGCDDEMTAFCMKLGHILEWEFGSVNELQAKPDAKNYLYTPRAVPMHYDGAFVGKVPHYIFFHCVVAPPEGSGGETTFCDTTKLLAEVIDPEQMTRWRDVAITYRTEKVVHYGGSFTAKLFDRHPVHGYPVVRYAEPVEDLNPVSLEVAGVPDGERLIEEMRRMLYDPRCFLAHVWRAGDVVIADNHALLHGRRAFTQPAARHLRRVNVL